MKVVQTFSAPTHLVMQMDEEIGGHRQKSAWICDAIKRKLNGSQEVKGSSSRRLMAELLLRDDVDEHMKEEIQRRMNS